MITPEGTLYKGNLISDLMGIVDMAMTNDPSTAGVRKTIENSLRVAYLEGRMDGLARMALVGQPRPTATATGARTVDARG